MPAYQTAHQPGDQCQQAQMVYALGVALNRREQFREALKALEQARALFEEQGYTLDVVHCDWHIGVAQRFLGYLAEAATLLKEVVAASSEWEQEAEAAQAQRDLAVTYNLLGYFDEANALIATARTFFERTSQPIEVALCDLVIGALFRKLTRYQEALQALNHALQVFRTARRDADQAKALFMIALVYVDVQDYEKASAYLQEAERLFVSANLPMRIAYCNLAKGRILWRLGKLREARLRMEEASAWFVREGMLLDAADCLLNLGNVAYIEGDYALAETMYGQARSCYDQLGTSTFVARCEQNLGLVYRRQGQLSAALDRLHRAADMLEKQGVRVWAADCLYEIADIYYELQQHEAALFHLQHAMQCYRRERVALSEAQCEVLKARITSRSGDHASALRALERACQVAVATGATRYVALCHRLIGDFLLEQQCFQEAIERYEAARAHFVIAGAEADEASCLVGIGEACTRSGQFDPGEKALRTALQTMAGVLPELSWRAHAELAHIARAQGDNREALKHYRDAAEALYTVRFTLPDTELAGGFAASHKSVYDESIHLALELEEYEQALEIAEESRAQVLERMVRSLVPRETADPYVDNLFSHEAELRAAMTSLRQRLICSFECYPESPQPAEEDASVLMDRLRSYLSEHRRLLQQLQAATNGRLQTVEPFKWERFCTLAKQTLPENWSALIYYWLTPQLAIFYVNGQRVQAYLRQPSPVEQAALEMCTSPAPERRALVFQGNLYGETPPSSIGPKYRRLLYNLLIPAETVENLTPDQTLLIVPHGCLHRLPFQALEDETGFLAEQAIIVHAPSLGILKTLLQRYANSADRREKRHKVLLVGIDSFRQPRPALSWVLQEVDRLSGIYGEQSECLRNEQATTSILRAWSKRGLLRDYTALHLATHACLDTTSSALSGIALWDADLQPEEISRLQLSQAVVTLSACQSGLGEVHAGDEMAGLPYAFFTAGARTVIVSMWHVDDKSTAGLMTALHQYQHRGASPAIALAYAQRKAIRQGCTPHEWGAFATMGIP